MPTASGARDIDVVELTPDEEHAYIQAESRRLLGMDADDVGRRWKAGEFRDNEDPKVTQVAMLLPDGNRHRSGHESPGR